MGIDPKIKAEALDRIRSGEAKAMIGRELGVTPKTLRLWAIEAGISTPASESPIREPDGRWRKGATGNPTGATSELALARSLAHRNAIPALRKLMEHADRLEQWLSEGKDPSRGQTMTAAELTKVLKILAGPALTPEKSTVEVQHSGEVAHAHRVTVEPIAVGEALDILAGLGLAPTSPAPAAVDTPPPPPKTARGPSV